MRSEGGRSGSAADALFKHGSSQTRDLRDILPAVVMRPTPPLSTPNFMPSTPGAVARTVRPCAKANTYPIIIPGDICDGCLLLLRGPLILSPSRSLTSRSLAIDRLKSTLLNVPLGKEPLLEAEVELKVYLLASAILSHAVL